MANSAEYEKKHPSKRYGRERTFEITDEVLKTVEVLGGRGLTVKQICDYFGTNDCTWYQRCSEFPELKVAFKMGKSKQIAHVSGKLIEQINDGSTQATIFYLKTQAGWKEEAEEEAQEQGKPSVTFNVNDPIEAVKIYQQFVRGTSRE
jgi:hypothetical protein